MPISKERKALYPKNWKDIVAERKEKVFNCCELCNIENGIYIQRQIIDNRFSFRCGEDTNTYSGYTKPFKVVLTLHHINNDPTDNRPCNLLLCCQRCHLKLDAPFKHKKKERGK